MRNPLIASIVRQEGEVDESATVTPDDLTRIKGIGEVREQQIYNLNILTYAELVAADAARLADLLGGLVTPSMVAGWQAQALALMEA